MSDLVLFKDLYKTFKDFQKKGYAASENKVQVKSASGSLKSDVAYDFVKGAYEWNLEFPLKCATFPLTFKSKAISPDNKLELTFEHKKDGLTLTEVLTTSAKGQPDASFTFHRELQPCYVSGGFDYKSSGASANAAVVGILAGATVGASLAVNGLGCDFRQLVPKWALAARMPAGRGKVGLTLDDKAATIGYMQPGCQGHNVGVETVVSLANPGSAKLALAWEDTSKVAPMKARFSLTDGLVQLSFGQIVASHLKATLSADLNVFSGGKAGFGLNILYDESF
jgi:hypothetical protein